jgi:mono/diheme cytochrome c family protein
LAAASMGRNGARVSGKKLLVHFLGLLVVSGLGFLGGELVYGAKAGPTTGEPAAQEAVDTGTLSAGQMLFNQKCAFCHFTDSTATKVGPGLKGLFKKEKMTVSGWPMTPESVRRQLQTPFKQMPPFDSLTEEQIQALVDYLQSL